jgi:hypothetical protein
MPITNPTTWRWPDSTFGPQNKVPFNDNNQYPDCGPSSRSYVAENILYGLENVFLPLLQSIDTNTGGGSVTLEDVSYRQSATTTATALPSAPAKKITLINISTHSTMQLTIGTGGAVIPLEGGYSMVVNVSNADLITLRQSTGEGQNLHYIISN